jgi:hypothetical protein
VGDCADAETGVTASPRAAAVIARPELRKKVRRSDFSMARPSVYQAILQ